jgi:FtsH-binding integral membrane protein
MKQSLFDAPMYHLSASWISILLFGSMILVFVLGERWRIILLKRASKERFEISGSLEGSMLGLLALLLAFTFGISNARYDARRDVLIKESNCIGTAVLRADVYPEPFRTALRRDFQEYVEARIHYYEVGANNDSIAAAYAHAQDVSSRLWLKVTDHAKTDSIFIRNTFVLQALNDMIDAASERRYIGVSHVPVSIIWMLFLICLVVSFLLGYGMKGKKPDRLMVMLFALVVSMTIYLILDLDRPREGIITMDAVHQSMIDLRDQFHP